MARDTRQLLAGLFLSAMIVAGVSTTARLMRGEDASANSAAETYACVE